MMISTTLSLMCFGDSAAKSIIADEPHSPSALMFLFLLSLSCLAKSLALPVFASMDKILFVSKVFLLINKMQPRKRAGRFERTSAEIGLSHWRDGLALSSDSSFLLTCR